MQLPFLLLANFSPEALSRTRAGNALVAWLGEHMASRQPLTSPFCAAAEGMLHALCFWGEQIVSILILSLSPECLCGQPAFSSFSNDNHKVKKASSSQ